MKSSRRNFLHISGLTLGALGLTARTGAKVQSGRVAIIADPADRVASSPPCRWAVKELSQALEQHAVKVGQFASLQQAPPDSLCLVVCAVDRQPAAALLRKSGVTVSDAPESLALLPFSGETRRGILVCGDSRGLMYALLELADRIHHSERPLSALEQHEAVAEQPFNSLRGIGRIFCSDIQDKPWFYDREMWPAYFSMLATQRCNRFSLNVGIGYDFLDNVRDAYFLFAYPFLLSVPGYKVRALNLPEEERDRNLEMLQFISAQAVAHGIDFHLGIWTHGYHWGPASEPNYTIEGLGPENHAAYSRDALTALLKACPDITGVTFRTHGESGVREGSYSFWSTVFSALPACGRKVSLDLHTKGLDQKLIDAALQTSMPVTLSPKYWAEHMGPSLSSGLHTRPGNAAGGPQRTGLLFVKCRLKKFHPLWLCRLSSRGPPLRGDVPHLARNSSSSALGRSILGGCACSCFLFLRMQRRRTLRTSLLQGTPRLGDRRQPLRLR